jgi:hypothetical protein
MAVTLGPPPPGPLTCFACLTNTCPHSPATRASSVHGGGYVPAVTTFEGTALCQDCAMQTAQTLTS